MVKTSNRNDHFEFWIPISSNELCEPIQMPTDAVREMVSDWFGASKNI